MVRNTANYPDSNLNFNHYHVATASVVTPAMVVLYLRQSTYSVTAESTVRELFANLKSGVLVVGLELAFRCLMDSEVALWVLVVEYPEACAEFLVAAGSVGPCVVALVAA